ncbi:MAG TPA: hypothetical protein O0X27_06890 [Methanocorpusculum sp.]|nr:hypothetical protein [Methanocorpusculum sp.]
MKPLSSIVYPQIEENEGTGFRDVLVSIPFEHLNHAHTVQVSNALYDGARASSKKALVPSGIGDAWLPGYYSAFICDKAQTQFISGLLRIFRKIRTECRLDSDRYLELLVAYVQGIPYDFEKTASLDTAPRFPVETVVDNTGICSDKSLLLAALLSTEGYACAILHFGRDHHAAVGIPAPAGYDFDKCGYAVIETTAVSYIGGLPIAPDGSQNLHRPKVIPIGNGQKTYSAIRDVAKIHAVLNDLNEKLKSDGTLVSELTRLQNSIASQTEKLRQMKADLESGILSDEEDDILRPQAHTALLRLQQTIRQYDALAAEFSQARELLAFIHHNRLNRAAVVKKIYYFDKKTR